MKMKKYVKAVCMALVCCFLVSYAMPAVKVSAVEARSILNYSKTATSDDGKFQVRVRLSVQDSVGQIIGYQVEEIKPLSAVSSYEIYRQGLENNNTSVYISIKYYVGGTMYIDNVSFDI